MTAMIADVNRRRHAADHDEAYARGDERSNDLLEHAALRPSHAAPEVHQYPYDQSMVV